MLANLQGIISHTMNTHSAKFENLMKSLQDCYDIVNANRVELAPQEEVEEELEESEEITE
jgi:hypothetical protein